MILLRHLCFLLSFSLGLRARTYNETICVLYAYNWFYSRIYALDYLIISVFIVYMFIFACVCVS